MTWNVEFQSYDRTDVLVSKEKLEVLVIELLYWTTTDGPKTVAENKDSKQIWLF